ncbi:hypothetical protein BH10BDE1_BH10BDE1_36230 [soil metagenome]
MHAVVRSFVFVATMILCSQFARAEFQVNDPKNVFADLKRELSTATNPFAQAMACGTSKTYTATDSHCEYRCSTIFCTSRCETAMGFEAKFALHIDECKTDAASVFGDNGLSISVSRDEYERDGTWVRGLLRAAGQFIQPEGQWTLQSATRGMASRIEGGKLVPIPNVTELQVRLSFGPAGTQTEDYFILIDGDKTGLDQILTFSQGLIPDPNAMQFLTQRGLVIIGRGGGLFP